MNLRIELKSESKQEWLNAVLGDFDSFLKDHANCERKASAYANSMVAKYPDRLEIIPELIETAIEELEHFNEVYQVMEKRGIQLSHKIGEDVYVKKLLKHLRGNADDRFMDRLILGSVIECRGAERFKMIYEALEDPELKDFYQRLWTSEAKHGNIFVKFALHYFDKDAVYQRLNELMEIEAQVLDELPIKAALH